MKLRLSEHLLMRVDKLTMAHAVEARVPFLDHDVVDFATRLPPSYKLRDGVCKRVLKTAAEPYLDHDMIYRRKQGFGAPMEEWFREGDFGARCLAAFERSALRTEGFIDGDYFTTLLKDQIAGRQSVSFPLVDGDERRPVARVVGRRTRGLLVTLPEDHRPRRRRAAELHEDRAGDGRASRRVARPPGARQHRPALRRGDGRRLPDGAAAAGARSRSRRRLGHATRCRRRRS